MNPADDRSDRETRREVPPGAPPASSDNLPPDDASPDADYPAEPWDANDARRQRDCFAPPAEPCECECLHCGRRFMSDQIWYQRVKGDSSNKRGFWMCPTPNCSGAGFTFDIFPTDPDHPANAGWHSFDDEDEEWSEEDEESTFDPEMDAGGEDEDWDPDESKYKAMDEFAADDDDIEGEEWKFGLQPGERPQHSDLADQARREQEAEERSYDEPDRRPREIEMPERGSEEDRGPGGSFREDDIPF